jgi:hypothetical protein
MVRAPWAGDAVYAAAERFVEECLRADGSLFTPGQPVWTGANAIDVFDRVGPWGAGGGDFWTKLDGQIASAARPVRQLTAEAMYVQYLGEDDTYGPAKRTTLHHLLEPLHVSIPADLDAALDKGLAALGAGKAHRPTYLRFLMDFVRRWKALADDGRSILLSDPWDFRDFVRDDIPGGAQAEALVHLVFPDDFEPIVSRESKQRIAETFARLDGVSSAPDVDRKLERVRASLADTLGSDFTFYRSSVRAVWARAEPNGWREFLEWAQRLRQREDWDSVERDYKLEVASNLKRARDALGTDEWLTALKSAFGRPNNLTNRFEHGPFLDWCEQEPERAREFLNELWEGDYENALRASVPAVPTSVLSGRGARIAIVSFLLAGRDATTFPFFRMTVYETACRLVERSTVARDATIHELYTDFLQLVDELRVRLLTRETQIDRLDAQGLAWWITSGDPPIDWTDDDREAFLEFRAGRATEWTPTRAWLVRGENAYDTNLVPRWLKEGFVSISKPDEPQFESGVTREEIVQRLSAYAPAETSGAIENQATTTSRFVNEMTPGDLIVTRDRDSVYIGRLTGELEWVDDDASGTARRRAATWLNPRFPAIWSQLSDSARRLFKPNTVIDLTAVVGELLALAGIRRDEVEDGPGGLPKVEITPVNAEFAAELFVPPTWLNEIIDLLNDRRQVIFYGPPGTGKTLVAQQLGRHVESLGGTYELIQFHPAYSYEDFFEGFRPAAAETSVGVAYELRPGPLRLAAERARHAPGVPHLFVIDEINRGNVAKIFGELFFLLEYRDRGIPLQYSSREHFALPPNLFFLGTMNTADRSIALVDTALRRRFYFVPFLPTQPPLNEVLRLWLKANGMTGEAADIMDRLNAAIGSEEFSIGPSYFIQARRGDRIDLHRVWTYAIRPLLEEHYYGTNRDVNEFSFARLRAAGGQVDVEADVGAEDSDPPVE